MFTSSIKREVRHFHVVVMQLWQRSVDKTIRCTCKVFDLLIKLIDWPYCASRIRRRSWRAVVSCTLSTWLHFACLERQCSFETESQDLRILSFFGHPWKSLKVHFSHPSGKYSQIRKIQLTGKRIS